MLQVRWPWKGAEREQMVEKRFKEVGMMVTRILDYMPNSVRSFSSLPCLEQVLPAALVQSDGVVWSQGLLELPDTSWSMGATSQAQVETRSRFIEEYITSAIRLLSAEPQEGKRAQARTFLEKWLEIDRGGWL